MPPRSNSLNLRAALTFAHELADRSGDVTLRYFRKKLAVNNKQNDGGFDPVTAADQAGERIMSNLVARSWSDHGVVGEEYGVSKEDARYRWVFDPIDGTRAFIMGQPLWGTLIGLLDNDTPILGMMNQPFTGERFWATDTSAHFRLAQGRAQRIKTREVKALSAATLTTTDPALFGKKSDLRAFNKLADQVQMTRYGGDCYNYCLLASGHIDLIVEVDLKPHDIVALIPIVERAGGVITTWENTSAVDGGRIIAAGTKQLHQQALRVLTR